jgi:glyoxylase-like metal-dependent hydrolase (beta-lactamase superfamily II)
LETDGRQFDALFKEGDTFCIGDLEVNVLHTPGHTPACITYTVDDAAFVGDTLFMPDYGTARADFPGGDAAILYQSISKILSLPPQTRIFVGHDYPSPVRSKPAWESTVQIQREENIHVKESISSQQFTKNRESRDATLKAPALLLPALQVNIEAGKIPNPKVDGFSYLKIPLNKLNAPQA